MITWANLEGLALDPPPAHEWDAVPARDIAPSRKLKPPATWTPLGTPWNFRVAAQLWSAV